MRASRWLVVLMCVVGPGAGIGATGGPQQPPQRALESFRVIRIAAGPRGAESDGGYRLDEERTLFNRRTDSRVIVLFRWAGPPGVHKLAAKWGSPDGSSSVTSQFDYRAADPEFGAFWTLPLSPGTPLGRWTVEATINGLPAGSFAFEVTDADALPTAVARRPLSASELYELLSASFIQLERSATERQGGGLDRAAAFVLEPGLIVTAFAALDEADSVALLVPDRRMAVETIATFNRLQDWVIIRASARVGTPLPSPVADDARVGDRCYSMEGSATGVTRLVDCQIVGRGGTAVSGPRLIAAFLSGEGTPGAPVVSEFGELVGIVGGALEPGASRSIDLLRARAELGGVPVVPRGLVQRQAGSDLTFDELRKQGVFMPAVVEPAGSLNAGFAARVDRRAMKSIDERNEFAATEESLSVFVMWRPEARMRGQLRLMVHDGANQLVSESKPSRLDARPDRATLSHWELPVPREPGRYRVDVVVDDVCRWRGFFRVR